jgi:hypothetical protein
MTERLIKKREARELLGVTEYGYKKLIAANILAAPFRPLPNSHPVHSSAQLEAAQKKIAALGESQTLTPIVCRPLSEKLVAQISKAGTQGKAKRKARAIC